jgi:hypothetical protein
MPLFTTCQKVGGRASNVQINDPKIDGYEIVVAEWLIFMLYIREVPVSNLGQETGYLDQGFSWVSTSQMSA